MKHPAGRESLKRMLHWAQFSLYACAALLLGYCAFALTDAWIFQRQGSRDFDRLLDQRRPVPQAPNILPATASNGLVGRIEIPRLLLSAIVFEGVDKTTLRRAVGHIPGTALPGQPGNVGLAGHRDTFFRPLKDLKINDQVRLSTLNGTFTYQVEALHVVNPDNVGVLAPTGVNVLTLVTCYPFYYVGPAPQRWIVRARQVVR